jgi:hypothetical protein
VPVRIVLQGLMLFQLKEFAPSQEKLFVFLINKPKFGGGGGAASTGPHHHHTGEIQILAGGHAAPTPLNRGFDVDISVLGEKGVTASPSFHRHVPELGALIEKGTEAVREAGFGDPNGTLIANMVTIDGGTLRVSEVITWDNGGFPLSGDRGDVGAVPGSHARMNFVGSDFEGHMASEVVVEIDADEVELTCKKAPNDKQLNGKKRGSGRPNHEVPPNTCEIIIRNYEDVSEKPTPWGLDFQWLIEAAGYRDANLTGQQFDQWVGSGSKYDSKLFDEEYRAFLGNPANPPRGRPFPYIQSEGSLTPLTPLHDKRNPPACVHLLVKITYTKTVTSSDGNTTTETFTIDLEQVPRDQPPPSSGTST